jgi:hypothetical protein
MKLPRWFWVAMAMWVVLGLPSFILAQGFRSHFSPWPDPPPFLWATNVTDQTLGTVAWVLGVLIVYTPLCVIPALFLWRRQQSRINDAQN